MKLLDLFEKLNTDVKFNYIEDSEGDKNRGWQVDMVEALLDDKKVGYLKIAYIPKDRFKKYYPTILNYFTQIGGSSLVPYDYASTDWRKIPFEELKSTVYYAALKSGYYNKEANDLNQQAKEFNKEQMLDLYKDFDSKITKQHGAEFKRFRDWYVDNPYVDYIKVESKRQGIGTALYRAGHEWMKSKGMQLHASGTQSKDAQEIWKTLEKTYKVKTVKMQLPQKTTEYKERRKFVD